MLIPGEADGGKLGQPPELRGNWTGQIAGEEKKGEVGQAGKL